MISRTIRIPRNITRGNAVTHRCRRSVQACFASPADAATTSRDNPAAGDRRHLSMLATTADCQKSTNISSMNISLSPLSLSPSPTLQQQSRRSLSSAPSKSSNAVNDFKYCVDLVQNRDREAYLCGLLLPKDARRAYFAIRAFNIELASIKDSKRNKSADKDGNLALQVRMQWWREALDHLYMENGVVTSSGDDLSSLLSQSYGKNPVVRVLKDAVQQKQLTRRFLERLLEAREGDLTVTQPVSEQELLEYADAIQSSLLYLSLECCDVREDAADVVAQHAGMGIGLVTALRGLRIRLSKSGEFPIPVDLIETRHQFPYHKLVLFDEDHAAKEENQLTAEERQMMQAAVEHVAGLAYYHLNQAQELQADVPKQARTCFLPVIPAMQYLEKLEAADYDLMDERLLQPGSSYLKTLFLMTRTWMTGVF